MYYDAIRNDHGLLHDPFKALIVPRPIGWVSSLSADGIVNLAPYSFYNAVSARPHIVGFSSEGRKDSQTNAEETGEFVCNLVTDALKDKMNLTSAPLDSAEDEMEFAGLGKAPSELVKPPRVAEAVAAFECRYLKTVELHDLDGNRADASLVLGQVVGIHIADHVIVDGLVDLTAEKPVARHGYMDYSTVQGTFPLQRPSGAGNGT